MIAQGAEAKVYYYVCFCKLLVKILALCNLICIFALKMLNPRIMKKIYLLMCLLVSVVAYAQKDVTKFLGIPVDGTKAEMKKKLTSKGFTYIPKDDLFKGEFNGSEVFLSIVTNNNKPIVSQVTNVTKINDGLVQSNPKDVAIFAKEGGVIGNFLSDLYSDVHSSMGGSLQLDTVNVQISGSLDLSSGGQSVDIINELQNNPILLRSLSRMLAQHISSAMNGGRGNTNLSFGSI